jgi:integrase/recombinase XerC
VGAAEVDAARLLLSRLGVTAEELLTAAPGRSPAPTFAAYVPIVSAAVGPGARRVYGSYWNRIVAQWGERRLDELAPSEIRQMLEHTKTHVVARRNARGGRGAAKHLLAALRCLYRHAEDDSLIAPADNPARKVAKPRRLPSTRRAVPDDRLGEINHIAATTGNDPALDTLLLRLHTETARRRGGALALRPCDLDPDLCLISLREKGETVRWQPVSPTLIAYLLDHADQRHYLWRRLGRHLLWVAPQQISTHWLRHTTLTWVERNFGYAVARAYAGHTDSGGDRSATTT